jgi:hypothetical protein
MVEFSASEHTFADDYFENSAPAHQGGWTSALTTANGS